MTSIIAGIQAADSGDMFLEGQPYLAKSSVEANQSGICMILQEKSTFDHLSVANNIFIGGEQRFLKAGILDGSMMRKEAKKALEEIGVSHISASAMIGNLSFEEGNWLS